MAKKKSDIVVAESVDLGEYAMGQGEDIVEIIEDNLDGEELSPFDLDWAVNPQGTMGNWQIPSADGDELTDVVEGIVIYHKTKRSKWEHEYGKGEKGAKPICSSIDGKVGVGTPGGACRECPFNAFGTGKDGNGKACDERKHLFMLRPGEVFPVAFNLSSTVIKPIRIYLRQISSKRGRYWHVITRMKLEKVMHGQHEHYIPSFLKVGAVSEAEKEAVNEYRNLIKPWLKQSEIIEQESE